MTRPGVIDYLIGNVVVTGGLAIGAAYFLFLDANGVAVIACLVVGVFAVNAMNRIRKYQAWKRDWDAMGEPLERHFHGRP